MNCRRSLLAALVFTACTPTGNVASPPAPLVAGSFPDSVVSAGITLRGTLLLPSPAAARPPVALIIAGSGPTDRDGNSRLLPGRNNSLRYLAQELARHGIASLRYDKRGIGGSMVATLSEADVRFDHFVDDVTVWGRRLAADRRFSSVIVIGHSEGSLLGMLAAPQIPAQKVVSLAGAGFPAGETIIKQLRGQLPPAVVAGAEAAVAKLERGEDPDSVSSTLAMLFRPGIYPYLKSWFKHDPRAVIAGLTIPTLIIQGTHDIQAEVEHAQALASARPDATLVLIPGMNHVLKQTPAGRMEQVPFYSDSTAVVDPGLVDAIVRFIRSR